MAQIVNNPEVPHISPINNGISPGTLIRIQGTAAPAAQRFNINLQCGPNVSPRDDIALHLSVRVAENCVGRNILDKQMWGEEQNQGGNPIEAGQQFEILILCDQMDYKIAINGRHFCEFPHKIPFQRVSHLTIDGDVTMRLLSFEMTAPPPAAAAAPPPSGPMPGYGPPPPMYGPPGGGYGGYGPPPPPGHAEGDKSGSGLEGFLGQAGTAIAGAFGQAVLQGALSGKQNANQPQPTQPGGQAAAAGGGGLGSIGSFLASTLSSQQAPSQPHTPQQPQQPLAGGYGGQSVGGLGSIGSFLTSTLANTILKPQDQPHPPK